jgi:tetratricopeptide (TPR) repeat protein
MLALCLALGAGCTRAARARRLLSSAEADYHAQRYDAAEIEYQSVLRLSYLNPLAVRRLGLLYAQEGRLPQAYTYLRKSYEQNPTNSEVQLRLAQVYLAVGQLTNATDLASKLLKNDPANEDGLVVLLDAARSPDALAAIGAHIQALQRADNDTAAYQMALGWISLRRQKLADAEGQLQKALQMNPNLSSAHRCMANLYSARKDLKNMELELAAAAKLSPLRSTARLAYAQFEFQSGSVDQARQILADITRQAPDFIPAWTYLMKMSYAERKYDDCASIAANILSRDPSNFDARLQNGILALARHNVADAISQFERMDATDKNSPQVKYHLALAYVINGDRAKATARLRDTLALAPDYVPAILLLGELDVRAGDAPEATKILSNLAKTQPDNAQAQFLLATAYLTQRQPAQALEVYRRMSRSFPDNPQIPCLMGIVCEQLGDAAHARESFEKSLQLQPDYFPALNKLTDLDMVEKHYPAAHSRIAAEIASHPKAAEPWLLQGRVYWAQGQTNEAESAMSKAIELNPDYPASYLALAQLYLASHQEEQALNRLNGLLAKTNNLTALMEIGMIQQQRQQFDAARDAYEKILAANPKATPALNNLAYLYSEHLGNLDRALQLAQSARNLQPFSPYAADTLGWILFKQRQYSRALPLLQESEEKQPADAEVQFHLGMTYYMMEDEDFARFYLQRAADNRSDFPGKPQARQCLAFLAINPEHATPAAIDDLQKWAHDNPRDPIPLFRLAAIDEHQGQTQKAADIYQSLINQNPQDLRAIISLARLYAGPLNDFRKALDLAKSAHLLAPNDPRAAAILGQLVYQSGDHPWALSLLELAARKLTNQPPLLYDLAWAYYAVGHTAEADASMQAAVAAGDSLPNIEDARQFLALRSAIKDPARARAAAAQVDSVLQKQPHFLPAIMVSALLLEQQGDYKDAEKTYTQVLNDYPHFTPAMRQLAILYTQHSENNTLAYELAEKARSAFPDDLELERALGILAYRRADYTRSVDLLRDTAPKFPSDGELIYYLGMDFYKLKRNSQARQNLERALALSLPTQQTDEARRVLAELK